MLPVFMDVARHLLRARTTPAVVNGEKAP